MLTQTEQQLRATFEDILSQIAPKFAGDVYTYLLLQVGPEDAPKIINQYAAFFQRGYDEAKLELMRKGMMRYEDDV